MLVIGISISCHAQTYKATLLMDGEKFENAEVSFGYTNFGDETEPEWVWVISGETGASDEMEHMYFLSENAMWSFDKERPYIKSQNDLAIVKNAYTLWVAGRNQDIIQIGTYGANIDGEFTPQFILVTIYDPQESPKCSYWIDYSIETCQEIYDAIENAIENLDIPRVQ